MVGTYYTYIGKYFLDNSLEDKRRLKSKIVLVGIIIDGGLLDGEVHGGDLGTEHALDGFPLELHSGGKKPRFRCPGLAHKAHGARNLELLKPEKFR